MISVLRAFLLLVPVLAQGKYSIFIKIIKYVFKILLLFIHFKFENYECIGYTGIGFQYQYL